MNTIEFNWEIINFYKLYKIMKIFTSTSFPETAQYQIQIKISSSFEDLLENTIGFYIRTETAFTGSYIISQIGPNGEQPLKSTLILSISNMMLLYEAKLGTFMENSYQDKLVMNFKFDIFYNFFNTTIHINSLPCKLPFASIDTNSEISILNNESKFDNKESLVFTIDGQHYSVSKNILCATNSSYFKYLCNTEEDITDKLIIKDRPKAFKKMLLFIINNSTMLLQLDSHLEQWTYEYDMIQDLLIVANKYDVQNLKFICEQILLRNITIDNALELIQLAFLNDAKCLEKCVAGFIKFHIEKFSEKFLSLPQEQMNKIIEQTRKIDSKYSAFI